MNNGGLYEAVLSASQLRPAFATVLCEGFLECSFASTFRPCSVCWASVCRGTAVQQTGRRAQCSTGPGRCRHPGLRPWQRPGVLPRAGPHACFLRSLLFPTHAGQAGAPSPPLERASGLGGPSQPRLDPRPTRL